MTNDVRIFGMHKAGTSFLMKALSHFCHRNKVALASSALGMIPLQAYDKWDGGMDRAELNEFLSYDTDLAARIQEFSKNDIKVKDAIGNRLERAEIYSIGDQTNDKRVLFYRNSSVPVWQRDDAPAIRVIRNPLSIVKSAYFSHKKTHSTQGWSRLARQRELLESISRDEGMRKTYEFLREDMFFHMTEGPLKTMMSWPEDLSGIETVRMEDMTTAPSSFLLKVWTKLGGTMDTLDFVPPEILTFEHQSGGRKPGEVDANDHMRSGDPEEWRDLLPQDLIDRIRTDYRDILETYYPSALEDQAGKTKVAIAPKPVLRELEAAYTELMKSRKETFMAEAHVKNWESRMETVLKQRDQIVASHETRFQNMKEQRDKALAATPGTVVTAAPSSDEVAGLKAKLAEIAAERDAALKAKAEASEPATQAAPDSELHARLIARCDDMKAQRDKALKAFNNMKAQRDKAVDAQKQSIATHREAVAKLKQVKEKSAETKGSANESAELEKLRFDMQALKKERDAALAAQRSAIASHNIRLDEAKAKLEEMKAQRDKALEKDSATSSEVVVKLQKKVSAQEAKIKSMKKGGLLKRLRSNSES